MRETSVTLTLDDVYTITLALSNNPLRPTLTEEKRIVVEDYLRLQAKIDAARCAMEHPAIENGMRR